MVGWLLVAGWNGYTNVRLLLPWRLLSHVKNLYISREKKGALVVWFRLCWFGLKHMGTIKRSLNMGSGWC